MRSSAFFTTFLALAYGSIAAIDETTLGDLTREVLAEQRSRALSSDRSVELEAHTVVATTIPGSITSIYHHPSVSLHEAIETMQVRTQFEDFPSRVTHYLDPEREHTRVIELSPSEPRPFDPENLVAAFSPGLISVLYHHEMGLQRVTKILREATGSWGYAHLFQGKTYNIIALYHNDRLQFENIS